MGPDVGGPVGESAASNKKKLLILSQSINPGPDAPQVNILYPLVLLVATQTLNGGLRISVVTLKLKIPPLVV
jgi:hypothetical protein